jgi:hypothetical protein
MSSGWGGIRTPGTVSRTAVFKTAFEFAEFLVSNGFTHFDDPRVALRVALTVANAPDLARIVAAWPSLPGPIRRAMIALIG